MKSTFLQKPAKAVTLQDIADRAKVTRALVSLAMRNSPKVAKATRECIQKLAKEMGYRPNPMVRALMTQVRRGRRVRYQATIAFLTNLRTADRWRTLHTYPDYFAGASERGGTMGYKIEHFWLQEYGDKPERFVKVLRARGISGVLVAPLPQHGPKTLDVDLSDFSVVTFGYSYALPHLPRVCNHHLQTIEEAIQRLVERGYQRIGVALGASDIRQVNHLWMAGLVVAGRKYPGVKIDVFGPARWTEAAFRQWCRRHRPEVIVGVTMEVWEWTKGLGLAIPEELGFLHLDCRESDVLAGMYQRTYRLGEVAAEMVISLIEENVQLRDEEPRILLLNSEFHEGPTVRDLTS